MKPIIIVTGGQAGVDQGAWEAAEALRLPRGGWMPSGYRTERGMEAGVAARHGAHEWPGGYPQRTRANVRDSDGLLLLCIAGRPDGPGTRLTGRLGSDRCARGGYSMTKLAIDPASYPDPDDGDRGLILPLLRRVAASPGRRLMVAGVRESSCPGIQDWARTFLIGLLGERCEDCEGGWDDATLSWRDCPRCGGSGYVPAAACHGGPEP